MKIFKQMTLNDAKKFYNQIRQENFDINFKKTLLNDIIFFTNNFTTDY